jgi:hypothetical protein
VVSAPIHNACHSSIRHDWRAAAARTLLLTGSKNATVLAAERSARVAFVQAEESASRKILSRLEKAAHYTQRFALLQQRDR